MFGFSVLRIKSRCAFSHALFFNEIICTQKMGWVHATKRARGRERELLGRTAEEIVAMSLCRSQYVAMSLRWSLSEAKVAPLKRTDISATEALPHRKPS